MKFFKMKAILLGTVVGSGFDKEGRVITDMIIHVDPDNKAENGRYSDPIVTEDVRNKLVFNKLAEDAGEATRLDVIAQARGLDQEAGSQITADVMAKRFEEHVDADDSVPQPTGLSTRETTNFPNRDQVSGDIAGLNDVDEADAAPAPAASSATKRKAASADA